MFLLLFYFAPSPRLQIAAPLRHCTAKLSNIHIRTSEGVLKILIPWVTDWVDDKNFCKELLKPVYIVIWARGELGSAAEGREDSSMVKVKFCVTVLYLASMDRPDVH